jgi:2'-5' RNA ligase
LIRLFAALAVPEEIADGLVRRQHGVSGARWRPAAAFHITLRFFGEVREDVAADLDDALATVAGAPLDLILQGAGSFGEGAHIHAVWAGVQEHPGLRQLAARCEAAARRAGLKPDSRAYTPHVTLAYLNRPSPDGVAAWLQANALLQSPPFRVDRFGLYSSHPGREGSVYQLEREYRFMDNRP